jgi:hypothetical protein
MTKYLAAMPRNLRWGLFFPVGIALSFIFLAFVDAGFGMAAGRYRTAPGPFEGGTENFVAGVTRVLFPAVISPRPWPVAIIMFTLDTLLRAGPFAYAILSYEYLRPRAPLGAALVAAGVVGGCLGLYLVWRVMNSAAQPQGANGN